MDLQRYEGSVLVMRSEGVLSPLDSDVGAGDTEGFGVRARDVV